MLSPQISGCIFKGSLRIAVLSDWSIATGHENWHQTAFGEVVSYCFSEKAK